MAARAARSLHTILAGARRVGLSRPGARWHGNEPVSSFSDAWVASRHSEAVGEGHGKFGVARGFGSLTGEAVGSLGLGFKAPNCSGNGAIVATGRRFFRAFIAAQQHSLETPNAIQEELQPVAAATDAAGQTADVAQTAVAQAREMQLKSLDEARSRIFGHVIGNGERSAHKVLRRKMIGEKILAWYPTPIQKLDPMFEDPNIRRRLLKNERLKRRGKGPPKKGHGKRAAKRAK